MASTNKTPNYNLPQFISTDKPSWLGDFNSAMLAIDTAIKGAADEGTSAASQANAASEAASAASKAAKAAQSAAESATAQVGSVSTIANQALSKATSAQTDATQAKQTAQSAQTVADTAQQTATSAASAASTAQSTASGASTTAQQALSKAEEALSAGTFTIKNGRVSGSGLVSKEVSVCYDTNNHGFIIGSFVFAGNSIGSPIFSIDIGKALGISRSAFVMAYDANGDSNPKTVVMNVAMSGNTMNFTLSNTSNLSSNYVAINFVIPF